MSGTLFLVGVPIGHEEDITVRALNTLKNVSTIVAEDTRKAKRLLSTLGVSGKNMFSHGNHNEHQTVSRVVELLLTGENIAYISDAGMPGISDPGYLLVRAALENNIPHVVIPGVTAVTTAITGSGLACDRFYFHGFLPRKSGERTTTLENLTHLPATLLFYEAPHRVLDTLADMAKLWPNRNCVAARELTKTYEEYVRGTVTEVLQNFTARKEILGEFTLLIAGASAENTLTTESIETLIQQKLEEGAHAKDIRDELSSVFSGSKKELYSKILEIKSGL